VEVKNVNSFKAVQQAVDFEVLRQAQAYDNGEAVRQETRMWDEKGT
jgi:aspartyl-tRNA(Asn)/glutamyl-tRNA(Gln) amidotransferase subunit B